MSKPNEHKKVQARILAYAETVGWAVVSREEAEDRRAGFPTRRDGETAGRNVPAPSSLFLPSLPDAKVRDSNLHGMGYAARSPSPARQPGLPLFLHRATLAL